MFRFRGFREDFRNGAIVATIAVVLVAAALTLAPSDDSTTQQMSQPILGRADGVFPQRQLPAESDDGARNATRVPVLGHHFLRQDTNVFQVLKILGALFLNLPLLDDMDVWTQTASTFEKQMTYLKDQGYVTVGLDDLAAWQLGMKKLPEKSVVITFDDGDRSVLEIAYPILKRLGFKATIFVVTSRVGKEWQQIEGLTWEELRFLRYSGVFAIESHTDDLHYKVKTSRGTVPVFAAMGEGLHSPEREVSWRSFVYDDLVESRRLIAANVGSDSRHLAWPYGFGGGELDSLAVAAGFHTISTLDDGMNMPRPVPVGLPEAPFSLRAISSPDDDLVAVASYPLYPHGYAAPQISAAGLEIKRYTITARTTLHGLSELLSE